jgi:hypothetical protein
MIATNKNEHFLTIFERISVFLGRVLEFFQLFWLTEEARRSFNFQRFFKFKSPLLYSTSSLSPISPVFHRNLHKNNSIEDFSTFNNKKHRKIEVKPR